MRNFGVCHLTFNDLTVFFNSERIGIFIKDISVGSVEFMVEIIAHTKHFKSNNSVFICPSLNDNIAVLIENFDAAVWNQLTR